MTNQSEAAYQFLPRPAAHAMELQHLMQPVRDAVDDLVGRITGAVAKMHGNDSTGKTTVLLSARQHPKVSKRIFWLDPLDVEPLPAEANLLTMLLTRIRNSLYLPDSEAPGPEHTSIFEECANNARQKLRRLINDAALMWEDVLEQDTRSKANRQIDAANIYASFRSSFKDAMDTLSTELGHRRDQGDSGCSIVLPIDNIDRSIDHLYSIVKLAQMVSHPRLWLVMAGDRERVENYLEQAYWKEVIRNATGREGPGGTEASWVIARHQANAAYQKLLPPSHRIPIDLVKPEDTLSFAFPGSADVIETNTIQKLLQEISIPASRIRRDHDGTPNNPQLHLIDLFDVRGKLPPFFLRETLKTQVL